MRKLVMAAFATLMFSGCGLPPAGTIEKLHTDGSQIEVYKYYYSTGNWVYVAKIKDRPNLVTTTSIEKRGKATITECAVTDNQ